MQYIDWHTIIPTQVPYPKLGPSLFNPPSRQIQLPYPLSGQFWCLSAQFTPAHNPIMNLSKNVLIPNLKKQIQVFIFISLDCYMSVLRESDFIVVFRFMSSHRAFGIRRWAFPNAFGCI